MQHPKKYQEIIYKIYGIIRIHMGVSIVIMGGPPLIDIFFHGKPPFFDG